MNQVETLHFATGIGAAQRIDVRAGASVADIAASIYGALDGLTAWVRAPEGHANEWIEIPRELWRRMWPTRDGVVMFGYRLGKSALKTALSVVAAVLVAVIAPYLAPIIGPVAAGLVSAAVGIGASLALNALFPPEAPPFGATDEAAKAFSNVESDSNVLAKEAYLPIAINRRISPPEIAAPFAFLEDGIQTLQRIFALDGQHAITDVQVDATPVDDFESVTTEIRDGAEATGVSTFINKVTKPVRVQETLSSFTLNEKALVDQDEPTNSEPRWVRYSTAADSKMEEISIRVQVQGFAKTDSASKKIRVPLRIRFREKGSEGDWFNIPEIHLVGRDVSTGLKEIRLRWDGVFGEDEATGDINYEFFQRVPEADGTLSDGSSGDQWQADDHWKSGNSLTATQNIQGRRNGVRITLDEALHAKIEYEFEIKRGIALQEDLLNGSYAVNGDVASLFVGYQKNAVWEVPVDQGAYLSNLTIAQVTSIVDRQPCQRPGTALLAIKSVGQSMTNITAHADRYVYDWDGSGWSTLTTTKNPATHFRQVLFDYLQYHSIDTSLIDNDSLVGWRDECIAQGYEVSAVFAGASIGEVLDAIAVAGYARRIYSDGYGVDWFRDRSTERPVQSFSPRNARIGLDWVSGERPAGVRASFQNEDDDFADDEVQVNNPFYTNTGAYVVSSFSSISNPVLAERRAFFDLLQSHYQGRRSWSVDTAIEGLICERGDLVAIVSDLVSDASSGARIREVQSANTFRIDQLIPAEGTESIFDVSNIFTAADIFTVGAQSVVLFSTPTGTEIRNITAADGDVIRVDSNLPSGDLNGAHIVIGPTAAFTTRAVVSEVQRKGEERATLICVDEAPEIYNAIQEKYG